MSDVFYVVSKETADAKEYIGAVAFNRTDNDADNEAAANDFLAERKSAAPWHSHAVVNADDFAKESEPVEDAPTDPAPSDPAPSA